MTLLGALAQTSANQVTPLLLSALKYAIFFLLFLFIWRSMRWVIRGLSIEAGRRPPMRAESARAPLADEPAPPPGIRTVAVHPPGGGKPRNVKVVASMVAGRGVECELRLDDTYVSQQHARLFAKNGSWYVEDLGSTNGTFVNEQKLATPALVQPGDKVRVGQTIMELRR